MAPGNFPLKFPHVTPIFLVRVSGHAPAFGTGRNMGNPGWASVAHLMLCSQDDPGWLILGCPAGRPGVSENKNERQAFKSTIQVQNPSPASNLRLQVQSPNPEAKPIRDNPTAESKITQDPAVGVSSNIYNQYSWGILTIIYL